MSEAQRSALIRRPIWGVININSVLLWNPREWMWFPTRHVIRLGPPLSEGKGASFYGIHFWWVSPFQKLRLKISIYGESFYFPGPSKTLLWTKTKWLLLDDAVSLHWSTLWETIQGVHPGVYHKDVGEGFADYITPAGMNQHPDLRFVWFWQA